MICPRCHLEMTEDAMVHGLWSCYGCKGTARTGEGAAEMERRESQRELALTLIDMALGDLTGQATKEQRESDRRITAEMEARMGQKIETTGCPKCGGTMYKTVEVDENQQPIGAGPYICQSCGHMQG